MPSWNVHLAHAERLLSEHGARALGLRDEDAFLLGNVAPDIYAGHMVPGLPKIDYAVTHLSSPSTIPLPDADRFWARYVVGRDASDVTLGAWAHLMCDHVYNEHTNALIASLGREPSTELRIAKQGDFARFGRTLSISRVPRESAGLTAQCAAFPPYPIGADALSATIAVIEAIVDENRRGHIDGVPAYELLSEGFFESARADAQARISRALLERAQRLTR